jgi:hypothetical protein
MSSQLYPIGKAHILGQATKADFVADTIKAMLIHSATTAYSASNEFVGDLVAGGIVARSGALAGKTVTGGVFDANDVTITAVSGSNVDAIILYKDTGVDASSPLIAWFDISPALTPTGTDMTINWNPLGIFAI